MKRSFMNKDEGEAILFAEELFIKGMTREEVVPVLLEKFPQFKYSGWILDVAKYGADYHLGNLSDDEMFMWEFTNEIIAGVDADQAKELK